VGSRRADSSSAAPWRASQRQLRPARKPGKLPAACDEVTYETEYSVATLQMHKGSLPEEARVVVVDDLLATGAPQSSRGPGAHQGGYVVAYAFVVELTFLGARDKLMPVRVESVIQYYGAWRSF